MAKKNVSPSKKPPVGKKAAIRKTPTKAAAIKKGAPKKAAVKKAGPARAAATSAALSQQVFTGTVSLDDNILTARLDGELMSMDLNSCSQQGVIAAHTDRKSTRLN